jgi:hypothetical protein
MKASLPIASFLLVASFAIGCAAPAENDDRAAAATSNLAASASPIVGTWAPADKSFELALGITGDYLLEACANDDCSEKTSENGTWTVDPDRLKLTPTSESRVAKPASRDFMYLLKDLNQKLWLETNQSAWLGFGAAPPPGLPAPPPKVEELDLSRVNVGQGEVCGPVQCHF